MDDALTDEEVADLASLFKGITTGPWKVMGPDEAVGDNWLVCFGEGWYVTTDHVHASEYSGDPGFDARFVVAVRNMLPRILRELVRRRGDV